MWTYVYCSKEKSFLILSDSLSSLKAIFNSKYEVSVQILKLYMDLTKDGKEIVFIWVPGHVGIWDNSAAGSAAEDALVGNILVELIPFWLKIMCKQIHILKLLQSECDEFPGNKLHKIFLVLKECVVCPQTNGKEETAIAWLHIGHSFSTHYFLLKGEELPMCIRCDKILTIEHILLTSSDLIEIRESCFIAQSLRLMFQDISPEKIYNFLERNQYFWKDLKLRSLLVMFMSYLPFKNGFKIVHVGEQGGEWKKQVGSTGHLAA